MNTAERDRTDYPLRVDVDRLVVVDDVVREIEVLEDPLEERQ